MNLQQAQSEGLCLRFPETIPVQQQALANDVVATFLVKGAGMAMTTPFAWSYIDKPSDGTTLLLFLPPNSPFPNDGIRFLDSEVKYIVPLGQRELEIYEAKFGYVPGGPNQAPEPAASRLRRRYRLIKGGNTSLILVHYTRGPPTQVPPAMLNQPVRNYPLRPVNEPAVFIAGEKAGQKVFPPGSQMHASSGPPPATIGLGMAYTQQQAMLAQQNSTMEALERRRERERQQERAAREREAAGGARPPQSRVMEEEDSGDEIDQISTRTLALARYKRNHDWMNDVFAQAAFDTLKLSGPARSPYSMFSLAEIQEKTAKLQAEVEALQSKSDQRRADQIRASQTSSGDDISMHVVGDPMTA
ncbi:hypothetical protein CPC08DRAFT_664416 [Agrocybe pediades]|nr:hypothetical protein CPC08DRAFT_664416 [Agrocybe pediades]